MPYIQCDIEAGLSDENKRQLVIRMTEVTHQGNRVGLWPYQRRSTRTPQRESGRSRRAGSTSN